MNNKPDCTGMALMLLTLAVAPLLAGCGDFWQAPGSTGTTASTTTLTASTTTPAVGASVTLTATVSPPAGTGTVTFYSGTTSLGTGTLTSGTATLSTSFSTTGNVLDHCGLQRRQHLCHEHFERGLDHCPHPYGHHHYAHGIPCRAHHKQHHYLDGHGRVLFRHRHSDLLPGNNLARDRSLELWDRHAYHFVSDSRNIFADGDLRRVEHLLPRALSSALSYTVTQ